MLSVGQVSVIEESAWFQAQWAPHVLIDADLRIRAVNEAYEQATEQPRECLAGELLFDAFPGNPADPEADGMANLSNSLELVFRRGVRHWVGVHRYDVPNPRNPGEFLYKVWTPVSVPIQDGRKTVAVLHRVQDVTRVAPRAVPSELAELRQAAEALGCQFPALPVEAVLGVLTHSHAVVMQTLGAPDAEQAEKLAKLRLEADVFGGNGDHQIEIGGLSSLRSPGQQSVLQ